MSSFKDGFSSDKSCDSTLHRTAFLTVRTAGHSHTYEEHWFSYSSNGIVPFDEDDAVFHFKVNDAVSHSANNKISLITCVE